MLTQQKYRIYIAAAAVLIIVIGAAIYFSTPHSHGPTGPVPDTTDFHTGDFSFSYARLYDTKEYALNVVSVGGTYGAGKVFIPLIDVVSYKSDPDKALPASFNAFMDHQAEALCGTDGSTESITCTNPVATPYTNAEGLVGQKLSLSLVRKNLTTGTTTTSTYAPVYVFNTTSTTTTPTRYQAIFVYASFSSFLLTGTTSPNLVEAIASTVTVSKH